MLQYVSVGWDRSIIFADIVTLRLDLCTAHATAMESRLSTPGWFRVSSLLFKANVCILLFRITIVGQLATPASVNFALSLMIYAAVTITRDGNFTASTGHVLGL